MQGLGAWQFEGTMADVYLTDITNTNSLDAIADVAMSEKSITNLRNKTAVAVAQEATDGNLYVAPAVANGTAIETLSPQEGSISFTQSTVADRPIFDSASGLLDFDGVSNHLECDITGITDRTDLYFACLLDTVDTSFEVAGRSSGSTNYFAFAQSGGSAAVASAEQSNAQYYSDTNLLGGRTTTSGTVHTHS